MSVNSSIYSYLGMGRVQFVRIHVFCVLGTVKECVRKDPDAQGSGSETRDLLKEQAEIRIKHRQGSETQQVNLRGDPETE